MQDSYKKIGQQPEPPRESLSQPLIESSHEPALSEDTLSAKPSPPQIKLFKGQVILNPTISRLNFVAYLFFSIYVTLIVLPAGMLSLPLLKIVYGLSQAEAINVGTITQACTLVYKFFIYPIFGALCDKYGRKPFIVVGVILVNTAIIITPNLPSVYPYCVLVSIMQDLGMVCISTPPLLADYIDYETKGRVAAISGVLAAVTMFGSTYATSAINLQDNIPSEYHYIGIAGLAIGVILLIGVKGGPYHKALYHDKKAEEAKQRAAQLIQEENRKKSEDHGSLLRKGLGGSGHQDFENIPIVSNEIAQEPQLTLAQNPTQDLKPGLKAGISEARRNPWILLGFLSSFVGYSMETLSNGIIVYFVTAVTGNPEDAVQAYNLMNKQVIAAVISICFFGYAVDKLNKFKILMVTISFSIVAVLLLIFSPSPYNFLTYVAIAFFGIAEGGFVTFNGQVLSKYPDPKYRASVSSVGSIFSTAGSIMVGFVGNWLSQFNPYIPFYMYLGAAAIIISLIIYIYIKKRNILNKL